MRRSFYVFRKRAQLSRAPHLLIYSLPADNPRVSVIVPKKVAKLATQRNSLRRALLDHLLPLAVARKQDLVVFLKSAAPLEAYLSELN